MLSKNCFIEAIITSFRKELGEEYRLEQKEVRKNNGISRSGLLIHESGNNATPVIYLDELYEAYREGRSIKHLVASALERIKEDTANIGMDYETVMDYESMKAKVVLQIINYDKNQEVIKELPHKRFLDLGIVFRLILGNDGGSLITAQVTNYVFESWNISLEELYEQALKNSVELLPVKSASLNSVLFGEDDEDNENQEPLFPKLYLMTNESGINGAATILYPEALQKMSEKLGTDLVILPSSIHEVLLLKYCDDMDMECFRNMVRSVNRSDVLEQDILSDSVYIYIRNRDVIEIADNKETAIVA